GVVKAHGTTTVLHGVDLDIQAGEFFVLLGPSGSGKTTTLRILAGLESVAAGQVLMDGVDVTEREPGERDVAMVFQSYALYPHMTVAQNIGFPLKMIGRTAGDIASAVADAAAKVGIGGLLARRPGQLSGGQQQRVALARAIVREPRLFLLDEPLSNLDAKLRLETRIELKKLQRALGVTTVYVTHDQEEAMTLADRVAVFMDGRIVQVATPKEIFARPAHVSVAGFIGTPPMNLLPGTWQSDRVTIDGAGTLGVAASNPAAGERPVTLGVRPTDLRVIDAGAGLTTGPSATVELVEELGDSRIVYLTLGPHRVKAKSDATLTAREGDTVQLGYAPQAAHLFDPTSGERLN
ncbi:MAG: ABC transporter ATP-binding protein, partial [Burkholderiaceae bacterium]